MTMTIAGRDPATGCIGIAVATCSVAGGVRVLHAESGVAVVAAQAESYLWYGDAALSLVRHGMQPDQALEAVLTHGTARRTAQVAILAVGGGIATHTGVECKGYAGHEVRPTCTAQANMMAADGVWEVMADAFESSEGSLEARLVEALAAGERTGGDVRGAQTAAVRVVTDERGGRYSGFWWDRHVDLRVDLHEDPVRELRRLVEAFAAERDAIRGLKELQDDPHALVEELVAALKRSPFDNQIAFQAAAALARVGRVDEADVVLADLARRTPHVRERLERSAPDEVRDQLLAVLEERDRHHL